MKPMKKFLNQNFSVFLEKYGFRIVDRDAADPHDEGMVTIESPSVNIRLSDERGQIIVEFQSNYYGKKNVYSWYSIDIVRRLITGEPHCKGYLDEGNIIFLNENIERILDLFSESNVQNTILEFKKLEKLRLKKLLGKV